MYTSSMTFLPCYFMNTIMTVCESNKINSGALLRTHRPKTNSALVYSSLESRALGYSLVITNSSDFYVTITIRQPMGRASMSLLPCRAFSYYEVRNSKLTLLGIVSETSPRAHSHRSHCWVTEVNTEPIQNIICRYND